MLLIFSTQSRRTFVVLWRIENDDTEGITDSELGQQFSRGLSAVGGLHFTWKFFVSLSTDCKHSD